MTTDTVGGIWTYATELCRALASANVHVLLATMGPPPSESQRQLAEAIPNTTLAVSTHPLEWMDNPWDGIDATGAWLLDLQQKFQPDIVHLNHYSHGALAWHAPVLIAAHSCVLSWWLAVKNSPAPASWAHYRAKVRAGLAGADLVVAPTQVMLDSLVQHYGPPRRRLVIPNGCGRRFAPGRKQPVILSAGRFWDEAKNLSVLTSAAADLPWQTFLAGPAPEDAAPMPEVQWLGQCAPARMAQWFGMASIYAHPARYEPFGLAPLEAAASGCALVLGDIPSLHEVWGDAATYVDPNDPAALHSRLLHLIESPAELRHLAYQARQRARRYTTARMLKEYLAAYASLRRRQLPRSA